MSDLPPPPPPPDAALPPWFAEPTLGQRFLGGLIDGLITAAVGFTFALVAIAFGGDWDDFGGIAPAIAVVAFGFAYEVGFIATTGRTPGKVAMGTRVLAYDTGGSVSPRAAVTRWFVATGVTGVLGLFVDSVAALGFIYTIVVFGPILSPPLHRGIHDRLADTIVTSLR